MTFPLRLYLAVSPTALGTVATGGGGGGGGGAAVGTTSFDGVDTALAPTTFDATTVKVYVTPPVRPETVQAVFVAGDGVQVCPPGDDVTV